VRRRTYPTPEGKKTTMKRTRMGAALAAVIALAALAATSVAAAAGSPEYLACGKAAKVNKKYTGKYTNSGCTETSATSEGKYERQAPKKFPIKTKSKFGETKIYLYNPLEHKKRSEVPCEKGSETGTINNSQEQTLTLTYTGCIVPKTGEFPGPCNSPGQKPGVVVTEPLVSKLVWLDEAETVPGIEISPATPGGVFEEVRCLVGNIEVKQTGSLLAKIAPIGEVTKLLTATLNADPTTGEPELAGYWEGGLETTAGLSSEIHGPNGLDYPAVPTSEVSTIPQKTGKVLIG
jgi:hypothetical protein